MAKTSKSETPPSSPRPPSPPSPSLLLAYRLLKVAAFGLALPAALLCLMAAVGALTDNGYARVLVAALVVVGIPLFIADRLLPEHDPRKARGLVTDVCSVSWLFVTFLFAVLANGATRSLLAAEGDRLTAGGYGELGKFSYVLAGVALEAAPAPAASPWGSASAGASASALPADAGAPPSDAGAAARDAGAHRPKGPEKTPAEIFKELSPSVVTVFVKQKHGEGSGTGFLIDNDGTIATNHHVIDGAQRVRVKFQNGAVFEEIDLLVDQPAHDLALLHVDFGKPLDAGPKVDASPLVLGDSEAIVVGERAVSIGNPLGLEHTLTDGLVSSRRLYENRAWIQFSAPISPGNSGGPLFNMRGEVIGVSTATLTGAQNINLAVPINELKKLIHPPYAGRRKFGDGSAPSHW